MDIMAEVKADLQFRDIMATQMREVDFRVTETIMGMFKPHMEWLESTLSKDGHTLFANCWPEKRYTSAGAWSRGEFVYEILFEFAWFPLEEDPMPLFQEEASLDSAEKSLVVAELKAFSTRIGMPVQLCQ